MDSPAIVPKGDYMAKTKLSIDEQIADMKSKGIRFELCNEADAKKFLSNNTYYFKLKAYEKNYSNDNKEHVYKDLDFEHIKELSKIDMYLRKLILDMCLDIEHILKTRLIYDCTINPDTDGYDIVKSFLAHNYLVEKSIKDKAKGNSACSDLASKYVDDDDNLLPMPIWTIVELLSFGDFISLYTFYYQTYKGRFPEYSRYLGSIRYLRNASAHSNCLIHSLRKKSGFSKTQQVMLTLSRAKHINEKTRLHKMSIPVVHDFVTLLLVYFDLLNTPHNRSMRSHKMEELHSFFFDEDGRLRSKGKILSSNDTLLESYQFICSVIKFIENETHKPNAGKLLKTN